MTRPVIAALLLTGCANDAAQQKPAGARESAPPPFTAPVVTIDEAALRALPVWKLGATPLTVITASETNEAYDLFNVSDVVRLSNGNVVFAANHGPINIYDTNGKHVRRVGRKGKGPGEFGQIMQLGHIRGDTIAWYDNDLGRISLFTPNGDFARSLQIGMIGQRNGVFTEDGRFTGDRPVRTENEPGTKYREQLDLVQVDLASGTRTTLARINGMWMIAQTGSAPFTSTPNVGAGGTRIYATSSDRYEILAFERGQPKFQIKVELPLRRVTDADIEQWGNNKDVPRSDLAAYQRYVEKVKSQAVEHRAQVYKILADENGFLWVSGPALWEDADEAPPWIIHSPEGMPVGRFSVQGQKYITTVGADYVILMSWKDDMPSAIEVWPLMK